MNTTTGLFVGSFDPFTLGHQSIVDRALPLFDRLVIGVGDNPEKRYTFSIEERLNAIRALYQDEPRISVVSYSDLTVDLAARVGARFVVKGVRNTLDFEYERIQADYNRRLGGLETILFYTLPELETLSSTAVRELMHFHKDISSYLPKPKH